MFGGIYCDYCKVTANQSAKEGDQVNNSDKVIISLCVEHGRCPCCSVFSNQAIYKITRVSDTKVRAEIHCNKCTHKAELTTTEPYFRLGTCYNKKLQSLVVVINLKNLFLNFITFNDGIKISESAPLGHYDLMADVHQFEQQKLIGSTIDEPDATRANPQGGALTRDFEGNVIVTQRMMDNLARLSHSVVGVSVGPYSGGQSTSGFQSGFTKRALEESLRTGKPMSLTGGDGMYHTIAPTSTLSEQKKLGKGDPQPEVRRQVNQHWAAKYSDPKN